MALHVAKEHQKPERRQERMVTAGKGTETNYFVFLFIFHKVIIHEQKKLFAQQNSSLRSEFWYDCLSVDYTSEAFKDRLCLAFLK